MWDERKLRWYDQYKDDAQLRGGKARYFLSRWVSLRIGAQIPGVVLKEQTSEMGREALRFGGRAVGGRFDMKTESCGFPSFFPKS